MNEDVYEKGYLLETEKRAESILDDGDSSPCPFCLDDVTNREPHTISIAYTINNNTGVSSHTETYHDSCWKKQQKIIHDILARKQHG